VTRYRLDGWGFKIPWGKYFFRLPTIPDLPWASVKTITSFFPGRKWPRLLLYLHLHVWDGVYMYLGIYFSVSAVKRVGIHVIGWLKLFSANDSANHSVPMTIGKIPQIFMQIKKICRNSFISSWIILHVQTKWQNNFKPDCTIYDSK